MNAQSTALFAPPRVVRRDLGDGAFVLASGHTLGACPDHLCLYLDHWADVAPDRVFLAERAGDGWRTLDYCSARKHARAVAAALLNRGLTADDPVMVLSDNSIDSALLQLGALIAGIPFAPVSPAYSLLSRDFAKLTTIHALLRPGLIFAQDGAALEPALNVMGSQAEIVVSRNPPSNRSVTLFEQLVRPVPMDGTTGAYPELTPDTIAKILFTSGSTGTPKGVINTHRMLCSNQEAIAVMWPFLERHPPVIVDWLPWNHTFGGNHNFNLILRNGGTLYIDGGKPAPGSVETTIANLKEISPTLYFNVPRGFDMILPALEADTVFRDHFFSKLDIIFYAAADVIGTFSSRDARDKASRRSQVLWGKAAA
ncbi:MAG: AMP-binding protein, partial [Pseudomonadota bacterium]